MVNTFWLPIEENHMIFGNRKLEAFKAELGLNQDTMASLPDALVDSYLPAVAVRKAAEQLNITEDEMQTYVPELLSYLLMASEQPTPMLSNKVDTLWHQFILCTKDYLNFCFKYFGKFIHHTPNLDDVPITAGEKRRFKKSCLSIVSKLPPERRLQYRALAERRSSISSNKTDDFFWSALFFSAINDIETAAIVDNLGLSQAEVNSGGLSITEDDHRMIEQTFNSTISSDDDRKSFLYFCVRAVSCSSGSNSGSSASVSSCSSSSSCGGD